MPAIGKELTDKTGQLADAVLLQKCIVLHMVRTVMILYRSVGAVDQPVGISNIYRMAAEPIQLVVLLIGWPKILAADAAAEQS